VNFRNRREESKTPVGCRRYGIALVGLRLFSIFADNLGLVYRLRLKFVGSRVMFRDFDQEEK
jgi:hypothetical protein